MEDMEEVPRHLHPGGAPPGAMAAGLVPATPTPTPSQIRRRSAAQKTLGATSATPIPMTPQEASARAAGDVPIPAVAAAPKPSARARTPAQIRVITAPRKPAEASVDRPDINIAAEPESLSNSIAVVGGGIAKILDGLGFKKDEEDKPENGKEESNKEGDKSAKDEVATMGSATDAAKKQAAVKQKRLAVVLDFPDFFVNVNTSKVVGGLSEVLSGGKDTAFVLGQMIRDLSSLIMKKASSLRSRMRKVSRLRSCSAFIPTSTFSMGSGYHDLRMVLGRQTVTRTGTGRLEVFDGFGSRKSRVPKNLCGTRLISTEAELALAIAEFKAGNLNQWLDVDVKRTSLVSARNIWRILCSEELTGLVVQDCPLATMALKAGALLEEQKALESHLMTAEGVVESLNSYMAILDTKLHGSHDITPKAKQD